ncbi:formyltransferase family protein [Chlamydiales bacterium]|nr:formyltransferase family protein [Chlamydiales bacterium]
MKILYLGPSSTICDYLKSFGEVTITEEKIEDVEFFSQFEWIVSYGYKYILKSQHILAAKNSIINLHISYLPWNRGADPNYWSWVKSTPKGVTIHVIDEGIDTGDIFIQKIVDFSEQETLASSYQKLKQEIEKLFMENFESILTGVLLPKKQPKKGTLHYAKDFPGVDTWDINVKDLRKRKTIS